jgi:hypothetical protein
MGLRLACVNGLGWSGAAGNHRKGLVLPRQTATRPFCFDRSPGGSAIPGVKEQR